MAIRRLINATYDLTERDKAVLNYRRLQAEQAAWNLTKGVKKKCWEKIKWN